MAFGSANVENKDIIKGGIGVGVDGSLTLNKKRIAHPAVDVTFTVGDESANVRDISLQLLDAWGNAVKEKTLFMLFVMAGASDVLATTGGSTGIEDGGAGSIFETVTAKKKFTMLSDATGLCELTWTDTGTESVRLAVGLPSSGGLIISSAFANA